MDSSLQEITLLRRAFSDIAKGFTACKYNNETVYIKHLCHHDHVELDAVYKRHYDMAVSNGIATNKEMLDKLIAEDMWSKDNDQQITSMEKSLTNMEKAKEHIHLLSQLNEHNKKIDEVRSKLRDLQKQRAELMGITAESYAEQKLDEYYVFESFYSDRNFDTKTFSDELMEYMMPAEMRGVVQLFHRSVIHLTESNIKKIAVNDFFQMYFGLSAEMIYGFFGNQAITDYTFYQVRLVNYGRLFRNITQRVDNIPDEIRYDLDKLIDYANTIEKTREKMEKQSEKGHRFSSMVGATEEDIKNLGGDSSNTVNLSQKLAEAKKQGKTRLDNNELMKILGR